MESMYNYNIISVYNYYYMNMNYCTLKVVSLLDVL